MITKKMIDILEYISMNGKVQVEVTPRILKQNQALYERVWRLENMGAIITERRTGLSSLHTITNIGMEILQGKC